MACMDDFSDRFLQEKPAERRVLGEVVALRRKP